METKNFITGLGIGMLAGGAMGMMMTPRHSSGKKMVSRALKGMGDVIDGVSSVLGR